MTPPLAATPLQTTPPHEYDIRMYSPIQQPYVAHFNLKTTQSNSPPLESY